MTTTAAQTTIQIAAQDVRPGRIIVEPDGRTREVRIVKYGYSTVVLVYTAGPCDMYRRTYLLDVLPLAGEDSCANCGQDVSDHDGYELSVCQSEHLAHLGARK